jgi:hypothetical protein
MFCPGTLPGLFILLCAPGAVALRPRAFTLLFILAE